MMNRRKLLIAASAGSSVLWLSGVVPSSASAQDDSRSVELRAESINDSMSVISGAGANVLVKKADNGELLVVDGGRRENAQALLDLIYEQTGSDRITTLVNTHWHREQTGLNRILGEQGVRIFAHENTRLWLSIEIERPWEDRVFEPLPEQARPNDTFYHYGALQHGEEEMRYGHMLQAHTDGDTYAFFPEDNVVHTGGVVSNDGWPLIDWWTGGWIGGLVDGFETLLRISNDDTVFVPANGPLMTRAEIIEHRDMYVTIYNRVRELFMAAKGPEETLAAQPAAEYEDEMGDADMFVLLAHQSLLAHFAPDA